MVAEPHPSIWREVCKDFVEFRSCKKIADDVWYPSPANRQMVDMVERFHEIIRLLLAMPSMNVGNIQSEVVCTKVLLQAGIELHPLADRICGPKFVESLVWFRETCFAPRAKDIMSNLSSAFEANARSKFADLLSSISGIFGLAGPHSDICFTDLDVLRKMAGWDIPHVYAKCLLDFAESAKDGQLKGQLNFIFCMHKLLVVQAKGLLFWVDTAKETEANTMEARKLSQSSFNIVKDIRLELAQFKKHKDRQDELKELFVLRPENLQVLSGLFKADSLATDIYNSAIRILDEFGRTWTGHVQDLADKVVSWCPVVAKHKDTLLSQDGLMKELLSNPDYEHLPAACEVLEGMRKLAKGFAKDGSNLPPVVDMAVLKCASETVSRGFECVTLTFGVYLVSFQLPKMDSFVERKTKIDHFLANAKNKSVTLGADMLLKLADLGASLNAKADAQPKKVGV